MTTDPDRATAGLRRRVLPLLVAVPLLVAATVPGTAGAAEPARGAVYAASNGRGEVRLLWLPVPSVWADGWRVEDASTGFVLAAGILPGSSEAMPRLAPDEQAAVRNLGKLLGKEGKELELGAVVYMLRATTSWDFALGLGLGLAVPSAPPGPRRYRIVGLGRDGSPTGLQLLSAAVDASIPTPPPPPPSRIDASVVSGGISVSWAPSATPSPVPVVGWLIFRDGGRQTNRLLTPRPLVIGGQAEGSTPAYVDPDPPRDEKVTYRVIGVDVLGRRGEAAQVSVLSRVPADLAPPLLTVAAKGNRADLSWDPGKGSRRAGFLIERGLLHDGPYELLTPRMLKPDAARYRDEDLVPGTYYFYRIRAVGPDGDVGEPSPPMRLRAEGGKIPRPEGLRATAGRIGVRLDWEQPAERVQGFMVERWSPESRKWARLTARSVPQNHHDDVFPPQSSGAYRYRVRAVGHDHREGEPSKEVEAILPDTLGPRPPEITGIDSGEGRVTLRFAPSTSKDVDRVYVVRSGEPEGDGIVVGPPLPPGATEFRDVDVEAGRRYWYRLVAFDKSENRGDLSASVSVHVPTPAVPAPETPKLKLRTSPITIVEIAFAAPGPGLAVVVERRAGSGAWLAIAGPGRTSPLLDPGPPGGAVAYRLRLQAADGTLGLPSDAAEITVP